MYGPVDQEGYIVTKAKATRFIGMAAFLVALFGFWMSESATASSPAICADPATAVSVDSGQGSMFPFNKYNSPV
jgi:hypothetical protein